MPPAAHPRRAFICLLCSAAVRPAPNGQTGVQPARKPEGQPPAHGAQAPQNKQLHSEGGDLLYSPILRPALFLPLRTPSPLTPCVFSSSSVLPSSSAAPGPRARWRASRSAPCQPAASASGYASPLVPGSPFSAGQSLSRAVRIPARHSLDAKLRRWVLFIRGARAGRWMAVKGGRRRKWMPRLWANTLFPSASERGVAAFLPSLRVLPEASTAPCVPRGHQGWWRWGVGPPSIKSRTPLLP